jgi:uncharacterized damage-inducible protein DinB
MTKEMTPAEHARSIDDARQRLISFVEQCPNAEWHSAPVDGDPRAVGVIADHVAHAYEYLAGWISDIVAGEPVDVTAEIVDDLNARHAGDAGAMTPAEVALHLNESGDKLIQLISGLELAQLDLDGGRVRRFAQIAARHADSHRTEIETALGHA